jgi:hypothetical protein
MIKGGDNMDIEAGLKQILERRKLAAQPEASNFHQSWIFVMKTTSPEFPGTYKLLLTGRKAAYENRPEVATAITIWNGAPSQFALKVLRRIFISKRVIPKRGAVWYRLGEADLAWLKGINICNGGRHEGVFLDGEVIAFLGANTIAEIRREGLYIP